MCSPQQKPSLQVFIKKEGHSFEIMIRHYQEAMKAIAWRVVGPTYADDVVQDAWLAAVRHIKQFEGRSSLKTWLLVITANIAKSELKQSRRDRFFHSVDTNLMLEDVGVFGHSDSPEALLLRDEVSDHLIAAVGALSELQRFVLLLHEKENFSVEAICNFLRISPSNARVSLHRARSKILHALAD